MYSRTSLLQPSKLKTPPLHGQSSMVSNRNVCMPTTSFSSREKGICTLHSFFVVFSLMNIIKMASLRRYDIVCLIW